MIPARTVSSQCRAPDSLGGGLLLFLVEPHGTPGRVTVLLPGAADRQDAEATLDEGQESTRPGNLCQKSARTTDVL